MDSASKRKATRAATPTNDARPAKRQKAEGDATAAANPTGETPESTKENGLKFLESLRGAKDKTGRPIATHFLTLPDKNELPDYYDVIKLPMAISTMEEKLNRMEYPTLAVLESDCKRLVNNAKIYNDKKSLVYEDAERLRKTASNWMTKHNPAYKMIRGYSAVATPVPGEENAPTPRPPARPSVSTPRSAPAAPAPTPDTGDRPRRAAAPASSTPAPSKLRKATSAAANNKPAAEASYEGKSFQQAQDQIITELVEYVDPESELQIFFPFVNLPNRALKDYYQLIKHPMSLTKVQKMVRGVRGREPPTGETDLKSWAAFEEEVSLIWRNARDYNEDGSELYNLSLEFEKLFKKKLAAAKEKVEEPPQPKLKLNMSAAPKQQLKLKLRQSPGSDPNTPGARSSATPGVIVDNEALLRQQRHVHESMNGNRASRPSSSGKPSTPAANPLNGARAAAPSTTPLPARQAASPSVPNGIKNDVASPALNSIRPASTPSDVQRVSVPTQTPHPQMLPPHAASRPPSGSPHPNGVPAQPVAYPSQYNPPNHYVPPPPPATQFASFRKTTLKSTSEALIPKITITTAPSLGLPKAFSLTIPADKRKTTQSVTINLPPSHSHIHIVPYLPVALDGRPWRSFYTLNGKRFSETPRTQINPGMNGVTPSYEGVKKKGEPLYDAKLVPGVNRIEIEVIAEKTEKDKAKVDGSKDPKDLVDVEKCTIFANLMRAT